MNIARMTMALVLAALFAFSCAGKGSTAATTTGGNPADVCCSAQFGFRCPDPQSLDACKHMEVPPAACVLDELLPCGSHCAAITEFCYYSSDCCSQLCSQGACVSGTRCGLETDSCTSGADCCSLPCNNGYCGRAPTANCHEEGSVCLDGVPCCAGAGVCLGGTCLKANPGNCMAGGTNCNYGGQCCTGLCSAHACTVADGSCGGVYAVCAADGDCCSGFCVQQVCEPGTGTCIDQFEPCDHDAQCCTGSCKTSVCV